MMTKSYTADNQISFTGFISDTAGNSTQVRTADSEKFITSYDAWGQLVEATVNDASTNALLRGSVYEYDALGRRILSSGYSGAPLGDPLSVPLEDRGFYYDIAGNVIQEDKLAGIGGTKLSTQARYVWSPDGQMILRDFNTDDNDANGLRIYVQSDAQGNVTALIDGSSGNVLERYTYGPFGTVEVRNPDWINYTPSAAWTPTERYNWVYLYEGMRLDPLAVIYHAGPGQGDYDPIEGRMMQPELSAFGQSANAYDPGSVTSDGWGWGLAQTGIGTTTGILALATPAAPFVIAAGLGLLAYQAYQGYNEYGGVSGALANVSGVAPIYEGWTDTHWTTGKELGLSDSQRTAMFSGGLLQLGAITWGGARLIARAPKVFGYEWAVGPEADGSIVFGANQWLRKTVTTYRGGSYAAMSRPARDGKIAHHLPADAASPISTSRGPSVQMDLSDHLLTSSHGSRGLAGAQYRMTIADLIEGGNWRRAMAIEVRDVRLAALQGSGKITKYNRALIEALDYAATLPWPKPKGI